ncbi:MAG: hypothetical protein QW752_05525, partial [Thermoplasmata archaeon]
VGSSQKFFVLEAKNPNKRIDRDRDVQELLSYMRQTGTKYGILYNGKELLAFELGSEQPFYEWSPEKGIDIFLLFSNDGFPDKLDRFIKSQGTLARLQNFVKQNTKQIKDQIIDLVAQNSGTPRETVDQYFPFLISLFSGGKEKDISESQVRPKTSEGSSVGNDDETIPKVYRSELRTLSNGTVIVCPSQGNDEPDRGKDFLKKYRLWRSVSISSNWINKIKYIAIYVAKPESKIVYFAEVSRIVDVFDNEFNQMHGLPPPDSSEKGKKAIEFKNNTLKQLKDPIVSVRGKGGGIRGPVYTDLEKFISARNVRDL